MTCTLPSDPLNDGRIGELARFGFECQKIVPAIAVAADGEVRPGPSFPAVVVDEKNTSFRR